ncbi:hypothetical protein [Halococcus hamelinensis]|uniref:Uncharacterized protein n=1 Tax=Halococcus hamelinensis 100A6 TaxID=1132509 RepID=M0M8R1_9EURY|nr:hypothetical protein [Halococcus hamelinensis]EMA40800.1 hypothetical protein C447_03361 [Halococcus hamelinensis 100A6]
MAIDRITAEADLVRTALQQKYLDDVGEPVVRVDPEGNADLFVHEEGFDNPEGEIDQPDEGVDIRPERFVGSDLDLPGPDEELSGDELQTLTERLGSELEAALAEEVDLNADRDGDEEVVPVEYSTEGP